MVLARSLPQCVLLCLGVAALGCTERSSSTTSVIEAKVEDRRIICEISFRGEDTLLHGQQAQALMDLIQSIDARKDLIPWDWPKDNNFRPLWEARFDFFIETKDGAKGPSIGVYLLWPETLGIICLPDQFPKGTCRQLDKDARGKLIRAISEATKK